MLEPHSVVAAYGAFGALPSADGGEVLPIAAAGSDAATREGRLGWVLFLLLTAALIIRPAEFIPALQDLPIYAVLLAACLLASFPVVLEQLTLHSLVERPITLCVAGLMVAVILSHLSDGFIWGARTSGAEFLKVLAYYLLLAGTLTSSIRLRQFLMWLALSATAHAALGVLHYHGVVDLPGFAAAEQTETDSESGESYVLRRLAGAGIFNDPNDLCLLLLSAMAICLYRLGDGRWGAQRGLWLAPLGFLGYAFTLTHSRGGFVGLLAGVLTFLVARLGGRRAAVAGAVLLPLVFALFVGRQTNISLEAGTGQERIQIWSEGLTLFRQAPVFGIGHGSFAEKVGPVVHNSYLHAFAELGFFGGTLFLGAFALSLWSLFRLGWGGVRVVDPELRRLRPYLTALIAAYAAGMLSLSRTYVVPTYLCLGLGAAYVQVATTHPPLPAPRFNERMVAALLALSTAFLASIYLFVRLFVRWG